MKRSRKLAQHGFSLIEMMMVVLILSIITGVVFNYVVTVQKRYRTEEARLDIQQESREFLDQLVRDLHTTGYPSYRMIAAGGGAGPNPANAADPIATNPAIATGLVAVSYTDILFEGDVDSSGSVSSIRYTLQANPATPGQCPCSIGRSAQLKQAGTPLSTDLSGLPIQFLRYATQVQNVINSNGSINGLGAPIGGPAPFTIAGNTPWAGITNQAEYGTYTAPPIFEFLDVNGNLVPNIPPNLSTAANLAAGIAAARATAQVNITINVLSSTTDMQTGLRPAVSMRAAVRIPNL